MLTLENEKIIFDVMCDFEVQRINLSLGNLKTDLDSRSMVVYLPGTRKFGKWNYSTAFEGAFRYLPEARAGDDVEFDLRGIAHWLEDGLRIGLSTFGPKRGPIEEIAENVSLTVSGITKDTCEFVNDSFKVEF